ncbi:ZrgA family zinc uptake protein [Ruegeria sp. MALMAid1280]|uniref:ZrgA family zinc uptake protein n=1 Tax=Ruegeria sp. MALMAid1280 TaxID=3411634 RepID=UPI003B9F751F
MRSAALALTLIPVVALSQTQAGIEHEHGAGHLDIAVSGAELSLSLVVPAADIVGFERPAQTDEDRALVAGAISDLSKPLELFVLSEDAACFTATANVTLLAEGLGPEAGIAPSEDQDQHTEFQADYQIQCQTVDVIDAIGFAYFERFPNALKLVVKIEQSGRIQLHEVTRSMPNLPL